MTRYEELTRKAYMILDAWSRCNKRGSNRFAWMWTKHFNALIDQRDAMTIEEAEAPALNPKMGKYAFS